MEDSSHVKLNIRNWDRWGDGETGRERCCAISLLDGGWSLQRYRLLISTAKRSAMSIPHALFPIPRIPIGD